jgi:hypothetical protein
LALLQASTSDRVAGAFFLFVSTIVFAYYTLWVMLTVSRRAEERRATCARFAEATHVFD